MSQESTAPPLRSALVVGTRPEAIKLAPVARAINASPFFEPHVIVTGQHREMLRPLLDVLEFSVYTSLDVMRDRQELSSLTARLVDCLGETFRRTQPALVVVQGDTTSTLAGALSAFYERIPVAHVEAGLRSGVKDNPFPEELNRSLVSRIARWHFAPTQCAAEHLLSEGVPPADVVITGNTVIDNLFWALLKKGGCDHFSPGYRCILVTLHRRENQGEIMHAMSQALRRLADRSDIQILLPLHKSPAVREVLTPALSNHPRIRLVEPLGYLDFAATLAACDLVLTDSGGVQEEASALGKPILVLRTTTERPEVVDSGGALLVGTDAGAIVRETAQLLDDPGLYQRMAMAGNPFGDGHASERVVAKLISDLS
ncbi:non-hydrolyzing UDP-N-acetylglucosamine 2-epimerase [Streptomyces netropsis]|uniref:non-hydrolyzing UDP-N-acetylglucosamine 2-epimerase n=1 Tax=Streptomyces netropsis TaxID=55404 RepID=UPI0037BDD712